MILSGSGCCEVGICHAVETSPVCGAVAIEFTFEALLAERAAADRQGNAIAGLRSVRGEGSGADNFSRRTIACHVDAAEVEKTLKALVTNSRGPDLNREIGF